MRRVRTGCGRESWFVKLAVLAVGMMPAAAAQDEAPTFRTGARLVQLTVTVAGLDGSPLANLKREDFAVLDGKQAREIAFFKYEGAEQERRARVNELGIFTNQTELTGDQARNVIALVLDSVNTHSADQARVRYQLLRNLKAIAPSTRIAIYHLGARLTVVHDFTAEADSLRAAIERTGLGLPAQTGEEIPRAVADAERTLEALKGDKAAYDLMQAILRAQLEADLVAELTRQKNRVDWTLTALEALGRHLAGIPGRKNLVWISGGIPIVLMDGEIGASRRMEPLDNRIRDTARRLAQQDVAIYMVDAKGLSAGEYSDIEMVNPRSRVAAGPFKGISEAARVSSDPRSALHMMASITGGRSLHSANDMLEGYKYAVDDVKGAYTLAFYAPEERDERWHELRVQVREAGAKVLHRQGYLSATRAADRAAWSPEDWETAISNPLGSSNIRLSARARRIGRTVALQLRIHTPDLLLVDGQGAFELCIADRAPDGTAKLYYQAGRLALNPEQLARLMQQGVSFEREWEVEPRASSVRVLVRDKRNGAYGAIDMPLAQIPEQR